jgi:hypothetical protein
MTLDPVPIVLLTAAVLGVLLVVMAVIAVVVLLPPVRRALAERTPAPGASEPDVDGVVADSEAAHGDGAEPAQR